MRINFKRLQIVSRFTLLLLFLIVLFLELSPAIREARYAVPEAVYAGEGCDCACISGSRPWYSTFNYWTWLWVAIVPLMVLSTSPSMIKWQRVTMTVVVAGFCYLLMNLAVNMHWLIKNGPFIGLDFSFTGGIGCGDISDGASRGFTLLFGWIPASLYVGFWLLARCFLIRANILSRL